ncbi:uncharacterized protein LOC133804267 isoform X3 [Humulus lupulus]|uniref:uncharacterized protein LOC133804267 isoform X3 n=2 Tax=Humulus lupulus TaxID=3486 RepID=UPI002B40F005|nr:uncharacterized protein LOC133804267 isoform X3 [Humulus lupulus]
MEAWVWRRLRGSLGLDDSEARGWIMQRLWWISWSRALSGRLRLLVAEWRLWLWIGAIGDRWQQLVINIEALQTLVKVQRCRLCGGWCVFVVAAAWDLLGVGE